MIDIVDSTIGIIHHNLTRATRIKKPSTTSTIKKFVGDDLIESIDKI